MKTVLLGSAAIAMLAISSASSEPIAITHAKAWTMTASDPVPDATILIDDGRIVSVTTNGAVPSDARVIDAKGQPVTPGIVNSATQLGLIEVSSAAGTRDQSSEAHGIGPGFDVSMGLNPNSALVALARADGVTGALSYPSKSDEAPFAGQAAFLKLRTEGGILDHAGAAVVALIGGNKWPKDAGSRAAQWQMLRRAFGKASDGHHDAGRDKGGPHGHGDAASGPPPGSDDAVLGAVLEGRVPLALFVDRESDVREAIRFAHDSSVHIVIMGGGEAWRAADALAAARIPVVLDPQANMPTSFDELGNRLDAAAILYRAGVVVAFGMAGGAIEESYNAGLDLREGAGLAVANGMPYVEALKAVTTNGHRLWGGGSGTLAAGETADIVLWDGDPLEPSTNAQTVLIDGRPVSTDNRQRALEQRYLPLATPQ
jgi:imidazolonepropionase-like amidohydrolase